MFFLYLQQFLFGASEDLKFDHLLFTKAEHFCWWGWCSRSSHVLLTHWGRVTHICVSKLTIIGSDNGLSPGRRRAIIWINAGILLIGVLGTNFNGILIKIQVFSLTKIQLKMSSEKRLPFCLGHNELKIEGCFITTTFAHKISRHVNQVIKLTWYRWNGDKVLIHASYGMSLPGRILWR